jgi:hypothetical protein
VSCVCVLMPCAGQRPKDTELLKASIAAAAEHPPYASVAVLSVVGCG